jgi:hypothetical protein
MMPLRQSAPTYTRAQIAEFYRMHQRGAFKGREADWDRLERSVIEAAANGRVPDAQPITKNWQDGQAHG